MDKAAKVVDQLKAQASNKEELSGRVLSQEEMGKLFQPSHDRKVRSKKEEDEQKSRDIQIPSTLVKKFIEHAWPHSPNEYMAWITGVVEQDPKLKKKICYAQGLFIPLQNGNSWNVVESDNALGTGLVEYLESTNSVVVGWIHSHPTFESFFSSIDQHMQFRLQNESDLAFGLVIDKHKKVRCMRLSPAGMEEVRNCPNNLQDPHIFIPHSLVFCFRAIYRHQHHYLSKFNKHIQV